MIISSSIHEEKYDKILLKQLRYQVHNIIVYLSVTSFQLRFLFNAGGS